MELHRVNGILDLDIVSHTKIVIIGMGSLGSYTAANLAYPWREIVLIDPEILEPDNVERHLLGMSYIGQPKAEGVKQWLVDRGLDPNKIKVHMGRAEEVIDEHSDADLIIVAVDKRRAAENVNAFSIEHNIPVLYGGIFPQGTGGKITVASHPQKGCYVCAQHILGNDKYEGDPNPDYGVNPALLVDDKGDLHAVPALRWAVNAIAAHMAGIALELLKGEDIAPQIVLFGLEWEPVLVLQPGKLLNTVSAFVASQSSLGLVPSMRLEKVGEEYELQLKHGSVSLQLTQWDICPLHQHHVSVADI